MHVRQVSRACQWQWHNDGMYEVSKPINSYSINKSPSGVNPSAPKPVLQSRCPRGGAAGQAPSPRPTWLSATLAFTCACATKASPKLPQHRVCVVSFHNRMHLPVSNDTIRSISSKVFLRLGIYLPPANIVVRCAWRNTGYGGRSNQGRGEKRAADAACAAASSTSPRRCSGPSSAAAPPPSHTGAARRAQVRACARAG